MNYKLFLNWWLVLCVMVLAQIVSYYFGLTQIIIETDVTYLTWVIFASLTIGTILAGYHSKRVSDYIAGKREMPLEEEWSTGWFLADMCLSLGMLGTVIGFIMMLSNAFDGVDVTNTAQMTQLLANMGTGMGVALYTTATGLVANLILKLQFFLIESAYDLHNKRVAG